MTAFKDILVFGDSLTQSGFSPEGCWLSMIADKVQRKCDIKNRGYAGYNALWGVRFLPSVLSKEEAGNVAGVSDSTSLGVSKEKIILIGPPPCDEVAWKAFLDKENRPMTKSNKITGDYSAACGKLAQELGVTFVDLYNTMMKDQNWQRYLSDGLHLSKAGSCCLADLVNPLVEKLAADIPQHMPAWNEVDYEHLDVAFT